MMPLSEEEGCGQRAMLAVCVEELEGISYRYLVHVNRSMRVTILV